MLAVTDGEASNPAGRSGPPTSAARRVAETHAALAALGVDRAGAPARPAGRRRGGLRTAGAEALAGLGLGPGDWLLGPWAHDGHPDHEATGRACARRPPRPEPCCWLPGLGLARRAARRRRLPLDRARAVDLPADVAGRARSARSAASSRRSRPLGPLPEDAPVLPPAVLERFLRPYEVVFA